MVSRFLKSSQTSGVESIDPIQEVPLTFQERLESGIQNTGQITGQSLLVDKNNLIDVPFIVTSWTSHKGVGNNMFYVNVQVITQTNEHLCFNDGGLGIVPVLEAWSRDFPDSRGLMCSKGLRRSDYTNNAGIDATTFYLT